MRTFAALLSLALPLAAQDLCQIDATVQPFQRLEVRARNAGQVREVVVEIGAHVQRGERLLELEARELEVDVHAAEAGLEAANAHAHGLVTAAAAARQESIAAEMAVKAAEEDLPFARKIVEAQQALVGTLEQQVEAGRTNNLELVMAQQHLAELQLQLQ